MTNQQQTDVQAEKELYINMLVAAWEVQNKRLNNLLDKLSDEDLAAETAPGRNTGTYLLGHLASVNDGMLPLMGFGDKLYPQLTEPFITSADKAGHTFPSVAELKEYWHNVTNTLRDSFNKMDSSEWLSRHTAVSAEDFEKEPHRNKMNILISRTNHQSYHYGQMAYLDKKVVKG